MSWKETCRMHERERFVKRYEETGAMSALCREFGISRKTGYKWARRYFELGAPGLADRSRRPHSSPTAIDPDLADALVGARKRYPFWGPRKLRAFLVPHNPCIEMPAPSSIGEIFRRHGLLRPRKRRRVAPPATQPFGDCMQPNDLWCTDFKGHFPVGDGLRCHPLTISDAMSRFLVRCDGVASPDEPAVRPIFESAFREFGLPHAMRSDNGPPFASTALGRLSRLSVWWVRLGIRLERIEPGHPEQRSVVTALPEQAPRARVPRRNRAARLHRGRMDPKSTGADVCQTELVAGAFEGAAHLRRMEARTPQVVRMEMCELGDEVSGAGT